MKKFKLEILSPSKTEYKSDVTSVTVPGEMGNFQILFNHAPIISSLIAGKIKICETDDAIKYYNVTGGTVEVLKNGVLILVKEIINN